MFSAPMAMCKAFTVADTGVNLGAMIETSYRFEPVLIYSLGKLYTYSL